MHAGTTYEQFIASMHLPSQLAQVDPIVVSFCGGAVGVLSTLLLVEYNNTKKQAAQRCVYCEVRHLLPPTTPAFHKCSIPHTGTWL